MLRDDWNRSHDLTMVAQLHACTAQDVIDALGLTEEEAVEAIINGFLK